MLGQSLKKVLHAYDLWPQVLNPGVWEACDFKYEARYIPTDQSKKGPEEGCTHSFKLLLPDDLLRSCDACFQTSLTAAGMKALRCPGTF